MPTYKDRLKAQNKRLSEKEKLLEKYAKDLATAQENIKKANDDISGIKDKISDIHIRLIADKLAELGISVEDALAAIEAGALSNFINKPPDITEKADSDNDAANVITESGTTDQTTLLPEKEGLDEAGSSGETVGSA